MGMEEEEQIIRKKFVTKAAYTTKVSTISSLFSLLCSLFSRTNQQIPVND